MFRIRMFHLLTAVCCLLGLAGAAAAAEVECGNVYCFCEADFSGETAITGICITDVPDASLGTLLLGTRVVQAGDILTAGQAAQMTFSPVPTETDKTATVGYLPIYDDCVAASAAMTIGIRGKENQAPIAEDSAMETYKNLSNTARLKASDPEGQAISFTVTRNPRRGTVTVCEDGSFTYTPKKNKVGIDSFTYTATDASGKVSREATVTITILKPTDAAEYTDTAGRDCRFAAEWMKHTGIFVGETVAESCCFSPDKEVTRGEFVTMLVKALDIPTDGELTCTGYTDEIPEWLQPYLAAAMRAGLTAGLPDQETFGAGEPITGEEAAVLLQNALDLTASEETPAPAQSSVPAWAEAAIASMDQNGFVLKAGDPVTRDQAAQALYQAVQMASERR